MYVCLLQRNKSKKMKNLSKGPLVMFSYFYQLLKHEAIVLITFDTAIFSIFLFFFFLLLLLFLLLFLVWKGYSEIETQYNRKNYHRIFKVLIPNAVGI